MSPRATAAEQLRRILYVLPAAAREGGASLEELADRLEVPEERVVRDLQEVTARSFYQRPGQAERLQIAIDGGRVSVWTAGEFRRPVKLSPREALALDLALRAHAAGADGASGGATDEGDGDRAPDGSAAAGDGGDEGSSASGPTGGGPEARLELARRLEAELAVAPPEEVARHVAVEGQAADAREEEILGTLFRAARDRRCCRLRYLSSGAEEPSTRTVEPWLMAHADGRWYAVSHCRTAGGVRFFRADRVLEVEPLEEGFEVPGDFDPAEFLDDGHLYRARGDVEVTVRYGRRVARWVRERGPVEEADDGAVVVTHSVSDPAWIVRHVLRFGPDAEVVDPPDVRRRVARAARRMTG